MIGRQEVVAELRKYGEDWRRYVRERRDSVADAQLLAVLVRREIEFSDAVEEMRLAIIRLRSVVASLSGVPEEVQR